MRLLLLRRPADLVIVDAGKEVEFVSTDPRVVIGGYMKSSALRGIGRSRRVIVEGTIMSSSLVIQVGPPHAEEAR